MAKEFKHESSNYYAKKIYPILNELSIHSLIKEIEENDEQWEFAELGWGEAMDLVTKARNNGLDIQCIEI